MAAIEFADKGQSMQLSSCRGGVQAFQKNLRGLQDNVEVVSATVGGGQKN